jgi:hypothetical protein
MRIPSLWVMWHHHVRCKSKDNLVDHVYLKSNTIFLAKRKQDFQIFGIKTFSRIPTFSHPSESGNVFGLFKKIFQPEKISFRDKIPTLNVLHAKQKFCRGYREIRRKKKEKTNINLNSKDSIRIARYTIYVSIIKTSWCRIREYSLFVLKIN